MVDEKDTVTKNFEGVDGKWLKDLKWNGIYRKY